MTGSIETFIEVDVLSYQHRFPKYVLSPRFQLESLHYSVDKQLDNFNTIVIRYLMSDDMIVRCGVDVALP